MCSLVWCGIGGPCSHMPLNTLSNWGKWKDGIALLPRLALLFGALLFSSSLTHICPFLYWQVASSYPKRSTYLLTLSTNNKHVNACEFHFIIHQTHNLRPKVTRNIHDPNKLCLLTIWKSTNLLCLQSYVSPFFLFHVTILHTHSMLTNPFSLFTFPLLYVVIRVAFSTL